MSTLHKTYHPTVSRHSYAKKTKKKQNITRQIPHVLARVYQKLFFWNRLQGNARLFLNVLIGAVFVIVLPTALFTFFHPTGAQAAWMDTNWSYRKGITVTNSTGSIVVNIQKAFSIDTQTLITNGKLQSNCQDLRFTDVSGKQLPYYIDSGCNTTTTKVWVLINSLPTSTSTIYMYYGNPSAAQGSNASRFDNVAGLIGYYTENDGSGSTLVDSSPYANNGTLTIGGGGTQTTTAQAWSNGSPGKAGNGLNFDGTDDYASATNALFSPGNTDFSWSFWLKTSQSGNDHLLLNNWNGNGGVDAIAVQIGTSDFGVGTAGKISFVTRQGGTVYYTTGATTVNDGNWHHIAVVRAGRYKYIYVDGKQDGFSDQGIALFYTPTGGVLNIGAGNGFWFSNAQIDDVRVYNKARTQAQVQDDYTNPTKYTIETAGPTITSSLLSEEQGPGPVAYWKFDEGTGTTTNDSSNGGNTGTLSGSTLPTWQTSDQCIIGKCLYFNGITSNVSVSATVNSVQSVSLWTKSATNSASLIQLATNKDIKVSSGVVQTDGFTSPTIYVNGIENGIYGANTWNHVEVVTSTGITANSITIGKMQLGVLNGYVDDVKMYNYVRSASQILADYNGRGGVLGAGARLGKDPNQNLSNGLVGYWKMDESSWNGTSGEVKDSSGNSNNGTATGVTGTSTGSNTSTTLNDTGQTWTTNQFTNDSITITGGTGNGQTRIVVSNTTTTITVSSAWGTTPDGTSTYRITPTTGAGYFGNGGSFNGVTDYISVPDNANLRLQQQTVSAWAKWNGTGATFAAIIQKGNQGSKTNYDILVRPSTNTVQYITNNSAGIRVCDVSVNLSSMGTTWHHYVGTYDGVVKRLYVDGVLVGSTNCVMTVATDTQTVGIGGLSGPVQTYPGQIDEARIYNRALSAQEVSQLYNFAPGPVLQYQFEEGAGASVLDSSGNGITGTWSGSGPKHWTQGKYGKAANFNGTDDVITSTAATTYSVGTIDMWFKPSIMRYSYLFDSGALDVYLRISDLGGVNRLVYGVHTGGGAFVTNMVVVNGWNHAAIEWNSTKMYLYLNGVLVSSASTTSPSPNTTTTLKFGLQNDATFFYKGAIDDVKMYNYMRTQKQIVQDMNANHPAGNSGSMVGYWKFNEGYGTTTTDSSGNGNTGTLTNMASPATATSGWTNSGKFGKALNFDGTDDYVSTSFTPSGGQITYSTWVKITNAGNNSIFGSSTSTGLLLRTSTSSTFTFWRNILSTSVAFTYTYPTSTWFHLALVDDPIGQTTSLYINGVLISTAANTSTYSSPGNFDIGTYSPPSANRYLNGSMDEVKVYNDALSPDEVKLDYNQGKALMLGAIGTDASGNPSNTSDRSYCPPGDTTGTCGPVADWEFDEGSGVTVNDSSGNNNTGTWNGTGKNHWGQGKYNRAGNFNGSDDYISTTYTPTISGGYTFNFWINPNSLTGDHAVIGQNNGASEAEIRVRSSNSLDVILGGFIDGTNSYRGVPVNITANQWTMLTITWTGSTVSVYQNGLFIGSKVVTSPISSWPAALLIGERKSAVPEFFSGKIDQVRLYNYIRSQAQIAWDYNRGAPVGWWNMDECQGTTIKDYSGFGNTGTLTVGAGGTQTNAGTCTDGLSSSAWYNGRVGKINSSLNFDGIDDYVDAGNASSLTMTGSLSVSAWIKFSSASALAFVSRYSFPSNGVWMIEGGSGNIKWDITNDGTSTHQIQLTSPKTYNNNQWHHVVGIYNPSTSTQLYIDGILVASNSTSIPASLFTTSQHLIIGAESGTAGQFFANGQIDDVRLFNYVLTTQQIKQLYNNGFSVFYGPAIGAP